MTPPVPCLSGFEKRAVNLKRREAHKAMYPVRKSCKLNCGSEWSCPALGYGERWREKSTHPSFQSGRKDLGWAGAARDLGRVLSLLSLCTHHIPAGAAAATAPFFSSCLQRFVWRKCSGDWILLQNTEAIRFSLFISQACCSMKAGIQTTSG